MKNNTKKSSNIKRQTRKKINKNNKIYISNPFDKPQKDKNGYVSLYKWDYPKSQFIKWNKRNKGKKVGFTPFTRDSTPNNCHINPYNNKKLHCWEYRGPNSLFFTSKQEFENELKYRYSKLKAKNKQTNDGFDIEQLRRIKNSMLGYKTLDEQDLVEIKVHEKYLLKPCINKNCNKCPDGINEAISCKNAKHLKKVAEAQGELPFSGVGYTIDYEKRGNVQTNKQAYVGVPEFIVTQTNKVTVIPVKVHNGDKKLIEIYKNA